MTLADCFSQFTLEAIEKLVEPNCDGYYILMCRTISDDKQYIKKALLERKILVNPTEAELIKYCPRQTYYSQHQFDKIENGTIVIEKDDVFWREHEAKYQEWLNGHTGVSP